MGNYNQAILKDNTQEVIEEVKKYLNLVEPTQRSDQCTYMLVMGSREGIYTNNWIQPMVNKNIKAAIILFGKSYSLLNI